MIKLYKRKSFVTAGKWVMCLSLRKKLRKIAFPQKFLTSQGRRRRQQQYNQLSALLTFSITLWAFFFSLATYRAFSKWHFVLLENFAFSKILTEVPWKQKKKLCPSVRKKNKEDFQTQFLFDIYALFAFR